jgi:predicted transcriptional regulator
MATPLSEEHKQALKVMRERRGDALDRSREYQRQFTRERAAVEAALTEPATVPEIAAAANLPADRVLWHLTAMRKYGAVREEEVEGDYVRYGRTE